MILLRTLIDNKRKRSVDVSGRLGGTVIELAVSLTLTGAWESGVIPVGCLRFRVISVISSQIHTSLIKELVSPCGGMSCV